MNILFLGDIVGRPGREAVHEHLYQLKEEYSVDFTIANGENASGGHGINRRVYDELSRAGIDFFTMGNHVWSNKEIVKLFEENENIVRPANFPEGTPGNGIEIVPLHGGLKIAILNLQGVVFSENLDCPFRTADRLVEYARTVTPIIFVDIHAEATSEKIALGWHLDGRVSAVIGTHTHIQTADERILPNGTAYLTDAGMTGARNSCLGMRTDLVLQKFLTKIPARLSPADGPLQLNGVIISVEEASGKATSITRISRI